MATYAQIQKYVKKYYDFLPKTCWIAEVKESAGLPMRKASNWQGVERLNPCPEEKAEPIRSAMRHFGMIE